MTRFLTLALPAVLVAAIALPAQAESLSAHVHGHAKVTMAVDDDTVLVRYDDGPFGAFDRSHALTDDGTVRVVPTPGHTPGHQSLLIRDDDTWLLLAGDVVFDRARLDARRAQAGIVERPDAARDSVDRVRRQLDGYDTRLFAAHDAAPG